MFSTLRTVAILSTLVVVLSATSAFSQSGTGTDAGRVILDSAKKAGADVLTRRAEEAAGRVFTPEQIDLIKNVLGKATGVTGADRAPERDDDDREYGQGASMKAKGKDKKGKGKGRGKHGGLPPGLAKKKKLPPGLQKRIEQGGALPPGLAKRQLPDDLEQRLGPPAPDTERSIVDNDVVLVERATGVVLDVIHDVITGQGR